MTSLRITLVVAPLLLTLAASAQTPPMQPAPTQPVYQQQVHQNQDGGDAVPPAPEAASEPLTFAEVMPTFPGGEAAYKTYLVKNIQYPQSALEAGIVGKVYVEFVVEKDGLITNVKTMRGVPGAPDMEREALRVVKAMPRWTPGKAAGVPVAVIMHIPIAFRLQEDPPAQR
ncbi:MAG: energy transducer TonB [Flavobacteriales bacterium]